MRKHLAVVAAVTVMIPAVAGSGPAAAAEAPVVSELRLGVQDHDEGIFSNQKEKGVDLNGEALFRDLGWFGPKIALRPHIGASINTEGYTHQFYAGLTATVPVLRWGFFEFSFGGAAHTGNLNRNELRAKDLGCRVLFRESLSLGAYLDQHSSISFMADHISNANLCSKNEGLETMGVRYGYRF